MLNAGLQPKAHLPFKRCPSGPKATRDPPRLPSVICSAANDDKEEPAITDVKLSVVGSLEDDAAASVDAWHRADRGDPVHEHVLAFESWEGLAEVMTGERYRLLRHLHRHPEPPVSALARALGRQYRRVHADVAALEQAGLLHRSGGTVHATADTIRADIRL